ncbi:tumor necrosis factor ligand superfamily member 14-like [Pelmatolapia mariae]|uniref:tumor necrosis factor ligand superfamily member 14-like n=1 Tax=Pelmatolapia mariae TaxID=158779 RepID=UPI002FE5D2F8
MADIGVELDRLVAAVPQNPDEQQKDDKLAQTLLFVLLTVVLYGIAAEAFFINLLYHRELAISRLNNRSEQDESIRGFAHLTGGSVQENEVMLWHINNVTVISSMAYKDGRLEVQKKGFYYVYSKVCFSDSGLWNQSPVFFHHIVMKSGHLHGNHYTLMQSQKVLRVNSSDLNNSFLGGLFHLHKGDGIFVRIRTNLNVLQYNVSEHFFGAFMM